MHLKLGVDVTDEHPQEIAAVNIAKPDLDYCAIIGDNKLVYHKQMSLEMKIKQYSSILTLFNDVELDPYQNKIMDYYSYMSLTRMLRKLYN